MAQTSPAAKNTVIVNAPSDPWQVRRAQTMELFRTLGSAKASKSDKDRAGQRLDAVLTRYEKDPFSITPMEAMDLYQAFYVPNEPDKMESLLKMVATQAILGWYDSLRFADESGRAEIANNEGFFKRALMTRKDEFIHFLEKEPAKAAAAVAQAVQIARNVVQAGRATYDVHWPSSYGLLRMQCGLEGKKSCPKPEELPVKDWPAAFDAAADKVTHYYRINKN